MRNRSVPGGVMKALLLSLLIAFITPVCFSKPKPKFFRMENLTRYVDPYIGTGGHGHTFLGANVPFGMVQLGPNNYTRGWDWCSGYHYSDSIVTGFGHMHLSGTGIGDLGDISFMPAIGRVATKKSTPEQYKSGIGSIYRHNTEKARPGYYAVHLDRYNVDVELTATQRCGFHKYTFPASKDAKIIIDLESGIGWDKVTEGYMIQENDSMISGYRYSSGWAKDQRIYFTAVFSKPMKRFIVSDSTSISSGLSLKAEKVYGQVLFETHEKENVFVKVAISPVSIANAKLNMKSELPGWNFRQTVAKADAAWNKELNKVVIKADNAARMRTFYTALYHTMIAPSTFCDINKDYRGADKKIHTNASFTNYTTFSLWDTYRAAHPLFTLLQPERASDFVNTMNKMGTFRTYTVKVEGNNITFRNLTIENNAEQLGQAVALHTEGDRLIFINCRFLGNQDTIYTGTEGTRLWFTDCYIEGTTDFIFGPSTALFEHCTIYSKRDSYITAASTSKDIKYGYVFKNCKLTAAPDVMKVYLGRPWRPYAATVFMNCELGKHILPVGWHNWKNPENEKTVCYAEYMNTGEGASTKERVKWSKQLNKKDAAEYTVEKIFKINNNWYPHK